MGRTSTVETAKAWLGRALRARSRPIDREIARRALVVDSSPKFADTQDLLDDVRAAHQVRSSEVQGSAFDNLPADVRHELEAASARRRE